MGVTANHTDMTTFGDRFKEIPGQVVAPKPHIRLGYSSTLSAGLWSVQNGAAATAEEFATVKDDGIYSTGVAVNKIAGALEEYDRQGREGIQRMFPDQAAQPTGGR